jgi:hypothetical protein
MRKMLIPIIALILIASIPMQAMAATGSTTDTILDEGEQQLSVMFVHTNLISANISITGNSADCSGIVLPASGCSASIRLVLYRSADGNKWSQVASWSGSAGEGETATASGSKTLSSSYQYKVTAYGTVRNSSNEIIESPKKTSTVKRTAPSYLSGQTEKNCVDRTGWGLSSYIN